MQLTVTGSTLSLTLYAYSIFKMTHIHRLHTNGSNNDFTQMDQTLQVQHARSYNHYYQFFALIMKGISELE